MGQLIRTLIQFGVSQLLARKLNCQCVWCLCGLCFKKLMCADVACERMLCLVPLDEQLVPFVVSQKLYLRHTLVGIGDDFFEKSLVVCEQTFHSRFVKEVCAVEKKSLQTTVHIPHVTFEIESGCQALKLLRPERQPG